MSSNYASARQVVATPRRRMRLTTQRRLKPMEGDAWCAQCHKQMKPMLVRGTKGETTPSLRCSDRSHKAVVVAINPKRVRGGKRPGVCCVEHHVEMVAHGGWKGKDFRARCPHKDCKITVTIGVYKMSPWKAGDRLEVYCVKCQRRMRNSGKMMGCPPCKSWFQKARTTPYTRSTYEAMEEKYIAHCLGRNWPKETCGAKYQSGGREGDGKIQRLACPKCKYTLRANPKGNQETAEARRNNWRLAREAIRTKPRRTGKEKLRKPSAPLLFEARFINDLWREDYRVKGSACCMKCCKGFQKVREPWIRCTNCKVHIKSVQSADSDAERIKVFCIKESCRKAMHLRGWNYKGERVWHCHNCDDEVSCGCEEHLRVGKAKKQWRKPEHLDVYHIVFDEQGEITCKRRMRHVTKGYRCEHCHAYVHKITTRQKGRLSKIDHGQEFRACCAQTVGKGRCMMPMRQETCNGVPVLWCKECEYRVRCLPVRAYNPNNRTRRATIRLAPEDVSTIVTRAVEAMKKKKYLHDGEREEIIGNMLLDIYRGELNVKDISAAKADEYRLKLRREYDPAKFTSFDAPIGDDGFTLLDVLDDAGNIHRPATKKHAKAA